MASGQGNLGKLKSIAIDAHIIGAGDGQAAKKSKNWELLRDFTGLELVFVVRGKSLPKLKANGKQAATVTLKTGSWGRKGLVDDLEKFCARDDGRDKVKPKVVIAEWS